MRAEQSTCRVSWLDVLKGIGIILVVIGHVYSNETIYRWLYSFHMPLFFFAAGWVYKQKPLLADISRRIQTIVIPYFTFGTLILVYWQLIEKRFRASDMSAASAILGLFSGQYDYLSFNVHLWFLPCFFVTVVVFHALDKFGGKRAAYLISLAMSVIYAIAPLPAMVWGIDWMFKFIGFYALGSYAAQGNMDSIIHHQKTELQIIGATLLLILNFVLASSHMTTGIMWFITATIGVAGTAVAALLINENKLLQYFGRISLTILCIHGPVYRIIIKIVSALFKLTTVAVRENFLLSMVIVAITMLICSEVYEIIIRIAPWMIGKENSSCQGRRC